MFSCLPRHMIHDSQATVSVFLSRLFTRSTSPHLTTPVFPLRPSPLLPYTTCTDVHYRSSSEHTLPAHSNLRTTRGTIPTALGSPSVIVLSEPHLYSNPFPIPDSLRTFTCTCCLIPSVSPALQRSELSCQTQKVDIPLRTSHFLSCCCFAFPSSPFV
jgi:hypothetical protein